MFGWRVSHGQGKVSWCQPLLRKQKEPVSLLLYFYSILFYFFLPPPEAFPARRERKCVGCFPKHLGDCDRSVALSGSCTCFSAGRISPPTPECPTSASPKAWYSWNSMQRVGQEGFSTNALSCPYRSPPPLCWWTWLSEAGWWFKGTLHCVSWETFEGEPKSLIQCC